jgi:hypothetical protein
MDGPDIAGIEGAFQDPKNSVTVKPSEGFASRLPWGGLGEGM